MKKCLVLLGTAAALCAGFGHAPVQPTAQQNAPSAAEDTGRIRITLPSAEEFEENLSAVGEALSQLAEAFHIERVPADTTAMQPQCDTATIISQNG